MSTIEGRFTIAGHPERPDRPLASVAQVVAVRVPAGKTVTPTYTGTAPTWVVEGE